MDVKIALGEYINYPKSKFNKVRCRKNYQKIEASWAEQREYIKKAVGVLSDKLDIELLWIKKDANRLPESIMYHLYPLGEKVLFKKLDKTDDPYYIVHNGNKNLSAVQNVSLSNCEIINIDSPLVSIGKGKILKFDNEFSKLSDSLTFVLYDNIWGTNFSLWYNDNAYFRFEIF